MADKPSTTEKPAAASPAGNDEKSSTTARSAPLKKPNLKKTPWLTEDLVLGWRVTKGLEPQHWEQQNARPGEHDLTDVVSAIPKSIAHHTVIIAQSGSGKSFFLGRLIEEILLKTSSRVIIFDTNSDFRKLDQTKNEKWWKRKYNRAERQGFLADERTPADFTPRWNDIDVRLHGREKEANRRADFVELKLNWLEFPVEILADETKPSLRDEFFHCHAFINVLAEIIWKINDQEWMNQKRFLQRASDLCDNTLVDKLDWAQQFPGALRQAFGLPQGDTAIASSAGGVSLARDREALRYKFSRNETVLQAINERMPEAFLHRQFVSQEAVRSYFSKANQFATSGLTVLDIGKTFAKRDRKRVEVVDLPALPNSYHQKLAVSSFLEADWAIARKEWKEALEKPDEEDDTRVPTFIVVEEAHNFIPFDADAAKTPIDKKLQEQFRRIAAEGRKFGRFLILVSQRPDKLDLMIMSECDNRAVMRVGSSFVLRTTCEVLGLEGMVPRMTEKVLDFDLGRALLIGPWMGDEPAFLVSAARRTEEGGRNLKWKHWAKPAPKPAATPTTEAGPKTAGEAAQAGK